MGLFSLLRLGKMRRESSAVSIGDQGEEAAAEYLQKHGHRIVARNWRNRIGELDIVALRQAQGETLRQVQGKQVVVFVEVKTRNEQGIGQPWNPEDNVTPAETAQTCAPCPELSHGPSLPRRCSLAD